MVYLVLCAGDAHKKDKVCNEKRDAEVQMDGGTGALDGAHQIKRPNADEKADQRQ